MIRLAVRRNRIQLPIWIVVIALFWAVSANAIATEFGDTDAARRRLLSAVVGNPTILVLRGTPDGTSQAALVFFQIFAFLAVLAALMSTFLATRTLRGDEERGRLELIEATPAGRSAPLRAALAVGTGANALVAILSSAVLVGLGFDPAGSALAGAALGGVGLAFLGIGVLASQVLPTGRSANGVAVALVAAAYLLRGLGDALGRSDSDTLRETVGWPSWISPIGWAQRVSPFGEPTAAPLVLLLALAVLTTTAAVAVQSRRDLGASLLPERRGRATAHRYLANPVGLLWRENRAALHAWVVVGALFGAIAGSLSDALEDAVGSTSGAGAVLASLAGGGSASVIDTFVVAIAAIAGLVAVAAGLQTMLRMRAEETAGRAELLLAAPVTRVGWLAGSLGLAAVSSALVALTAGLVAGLAFLGTGASADRLGTSVLAGVAQLPMIACFLGIATLAVAVLPRAAVGIAWLALAVGYALGPLGGILRLATWARDISPFEHTPQVPGPDPDWGPAMIVLAVGVVCAAVALVAMRTRQVTA